MCAPVRWISLLRAGLITASSCAPIAHRSFAAECHPATAFELRFMKFVSVAAAVGVSSVMSAVKQTLHMN